MVLSKPALLALFVTGCASAQFSSPLIVQANGGADPACVRLYEQRANGNNFIAFCAPNAVTTTTAITLPNAGGQLLLAPTAAAPVTNFFSTNNFSEVYKICVPATTFGTCWTAQNVSGTGGLSMEFLDTFGSSLIVFDGGANTLVTKYILPRTDATYNLGDLTHRWTTGYFSSTLRFGGAESTGSITPSADNTYDLGGSTSLDWRRVHFQDALIQNGTTRIDSSGNLTVAGLSSSLIPTSDATYSIGSSSFRISAITGTTFTSYDGATSRVQILNPGSGSDSGPALTIRNNSGTAIFETRYSTATTTVSNLTATGTIIDSDGSVNRVEIANPGSGSDSGAGIVQRNAAGSVVFRTYYNGNIETAYTGGGNVVMCVTAGGVLFRGASTTSC